MVQLITKKEIFIKIDEEKRYPCPCCGFLTMFGPVRHTFIICPICGWEDDEVQYYDPDREGGANTLSLNQARANYAKIGAINRQAHSNVRPPIPEEMPPKNLRKIHPCPCCGYLTMAAPFHRTKDICPICGWEDDVIQTIDPDIKGGVNIVSLNQARANYAMFGARDKEALSRVRPPRPNEMPAKEK